MTEPHAPAARRPSTTLPVTEDRADPRRTVLLCWLIFTLLYWAGAWHKPYAAHDFYSWVYAERCEVSGILTLEDTGIGHPPLYHLAQKSVQALIPRFHPLNARLANFVFGSLFVIAFAALIGRRPGYTFFCCGIAASATTLDSFMLCRMWGLVCLISLLLIIVGQRLRRRFSGWTLALFLALFILGLCSDYSFALLLPYAVLVCLPSGRWGRRLAHGTLAATGLVLLLLRLRHAGKTGNPGAGIFSLLSDTFNTVAEIGLMVFNFWFEETFLIALTLFAAFLAFGGHRAWKTSRTERSPLNLRLMSLSLLVVLFSSILVRTDLIRVRYAAVPLLVFLLLALWGRRRYPYFDHLRVDDCCLAGMAGGLAFLLAIHPYFWTGLIHIRYFSALIPLLLLFLAERFHRQALRVLAGLMICSGLIYTASNGLVLYYPPPAVSGPDPVVFADVYSYSNHYFHRDAGTGKTPWIVDQQNFVSSCRVCRMGRAHVPWQRFQRFRLVEPVHLDLKTPVPGQFEKLGEEIHLSRMDRLQFHWLTPIRIRRYKVSDYQRQDPGSEVR